MDKETVTSLETLQTTFIEHTNMKEPLSYAQIIGTSLAFSPLRDRIIVEEDTFRTGYECKECDGSGEVKCRSCDGLGKVYQRKYDIDTKSWEVNSTLYTSCTECVHGQVVCSTCKGKGASIIVPEQSQRRPSSGIVRAIGPDVVGIAINNHVMYGLHAGHVIEFRKKRVVIKILRQDEILCFVAGVMNATEGL